MTAPQLATGVLCNTVIIEGAGIGPRVIKAGTTVTDTALATAILNVGGVFANPTDPIIIAAVAIVQKMGAKFRAQDERVLDSIMMAAWASSIFGAAPQRLSVALTLAIIQAQTTGVAFNIGPNAAGAGAAGASALAMPTNARLLRADLTVVTPVTGGTLSALTAKVQGGADTAGSIIGGAGGSNVFVAGGPFTETTGSSPYANRSAQQLKATLTATGDTLANATAGSLIIDIYYALLP